MRDNYKIIHLKNLIFSTSNELKLSESMLFL